jgi:hypothetical protein
MPKLDTAIVRCWSGLSDAYPKSVLSSKLISGQIVENGWTRENKIKNVKTFPRHPLLRCGCSRLPVVSFELDINKSHQYVAKNRNRLALHVLATGSNLWRPSRRPKVAFWGVLRTTICAYHDQLRRLAILHHRSGSYPCPDTIGRVENSQRGWTCLQLREWEVRSFIFGISENLRGRGTVKCSQPDANLTYACIAIVSCYTFELGPVPRQSRHLLPRNPNYPIGHPSRWGGGATARISF